jgi:hypothetical protein
MHAVLLETAYLPFTNHVFGYRESDWAVSVRQARNHERAVWSLCHFVGVHTAHAAGNVRLYPAVSKKSTA